VLDEEGKIPLAGLFIAFKLKRERAEDDSSPAAKILRVIETAKKPNDLAEQASKKEKENYAKLLAQYEEQIKETPPHPSDRFVLGIVDERGHLQPVHANGNAWRDIATSRDPDTYKVATGEKYLALLIRHPSPDLARALTRKLNGGEMGRDDVDLGDKEL